MDSSGIAPESSVCRTDVVLLDHEPDCSSSASGSRGTRTHKRDLRAACFQDRFLIQSDDFRDLQTAGVGIEPTPPGSEPSIATSSDYPAMVVRQMTRSQLRSSRIAGAGIEPADSWFKATDFYQQKLPRNGRVPCGNRTRLSSLEG